MIIFILQPTQRYADVFQSMSENVLTNGSSDYEIIEEEVFGIIRSIKDPEKPETLEDLKVVSEDNVSVVSLENQSLRIKVVFTPTVSHCQLATLIGLTIRVKLQQELPYSYKLDVLIADGTHDAVDEINKQINDKERVSAAMENESLRKLVLECINTPY